MRRHDAERRRLKYDRRIRRDAQGVSAVKRDRVKTDLVCDRGAGQFRLEAHAFRLMLESFLPQKLDYSEQQHGMRRRAVETQREICVEEHVLERFIPGGQNVAQRAAICPHFQSVDVEVVGGAEGL